MRMAIRMVIKKDNTPVKSLRDYYNNNFYLRILGTEFRRDLDGEVKCNFFTIYKSKLSF